MRSIAAMAVQVVASRLRRSELLRCGYFGCAPEKYIHQICDTVNKLNSA